MARDDGCFSIPPCGGGALSVGRLRALSLKRVVHYDGERDTGKEKERHREVEESPYDETALGGTGAVVRLRLSTI